MPNNEIDTSRLLKLAAEMMSALTRKCDTEIALSHQRTDKTSREYMLTPFEGWPGKNEGERAIARVKAFTADPILRNIEENQRRLEDELKTIESEIQVIEAERRALEWYIRAKLVLALARERVQVEEATPIDRNDAAYFDAIADECAIQETMRQATVDELKGYVAELPF